MNNTVYNHMNKNLEKLCDRQSKAWRNLKNMKIEWRNRFCLTDEERFELEQCQHEYDSLTDRIDQLKDRLLTFELFGEQSPSPRTINGSGFWWQKQ